MGLVNAIVPDENVLAAAHELAARLAAGPTVAYAAIKEAIAFAGSSTLAQPWPRRPNCRTAPAPPPTTPTR